MIHVQIFLQLITGVSCLILAMWATAGERTVLFHEEFNDLSDWRPLTFAKLGEHTSYEVVRKNNDAYLQARSNDSASAILYKEKMDHLPISCN